jgi:hypothetical protein
MPIGDPFVFLLIGVAALSLLWFAWFAAESALQGPRGVTAVGAVPRTTKRPSFDYPRPVDVTLPRRQSTLIMYSPAERTELDSCRGADAAGKCPRALADGTVACAGSLLSLPAPIRGSAEWQIPVGYKTCPVASYDFYRQASSPN